MGQGFRIVEPGLLLRNGPAEGFCSAVSVGDLSRERQPDPTVGVYSEPLSRLMSEMLQVESPHRLFSVRAVDLVTANAIEPAAERSPSRWTQLVLEAVVVAESWQFDNSLESVTRSRGVGAVVASRWLWLLAAARLRMGLMSWGDAMSQEQALELSAILEEGLTATRRNQAAHEQFREISDRIVVEWQIPAPASPVPDLGEAVSSSGQRLRWLLGRNRGSSRG